jgi:hypothetical protein
MGLLDTLPSQIALAVTEQITYAWDTSNYVASTGDTAIEDPSVIMTDVTATPNVVISLPDEPEIDGLQVLQLLKGSSVVAGHNYTLVVSFTGVQSGQVLSMFTNLVCPTP